VAVGVEVAFVGASAAEAGALDLDADSDCDCEQAAVSYAPPGLGLISGRHSWLARHGLHSFAPSELRIAHN
jgi:hypothetical protein